MTRTIRSKWIQRACWTRLRTFSRQIIYCILLGCRSICDKTRTLASRKNSWAASSESQFATNMRPGLHSFNRDLCLTKSRPSTLPDLKRARKRNRSPWRKSECVPFLPLQPASRESSGSRKHRDCSILSSAFGRRAMCRVGARAKTHRSEGQRTITPEL